MFDDLNKNQEGQGGIGGPKPVEDIFSDTDEATNVEKPAAFQPKMPSQEQLIDEEPQGFDKRYFVLGLLVLGLVAIGAGGYYFYKQYASKSAVNGIAEKQGQDQVQNQDQEQEIVSGQDAINQVIDNIIADQDQDGLNDEEERALGTDPNSIDSDNDGLFDREEAKVYKTDPLNPDTDGDSHQDGVEVKNGFNPNGPGRLFEIQ